MAGIPMGAPAPDTQAPGATPRRTLYRVPASTRTRHLRGVCLAGDTLVSIYSARGAADGRAVSITLFTGADERTGYMTPTQARTIAQAMVDAAEAADEAHSRKGGEQ